MGKKSKPIYLRPDVYLVMVSAECGYQNSIESTFREEEQGW